MFFFWKIIYLAITFLDGWLNHHQVDGRYFASIFQIAAQSIRDSLSITAESFNHPQDLSNFLLGKLNYHNVIEIIDIPLHLHFIQPIFLKPQRVASSLNG